VDAGYHTPLEEYLETIQALDDEGTEVIGARIAERLGRSAPAVKEMLDRMEEDGYVARVGRVVELTDQGRDLATTVVRRHRLAERLLVDVIGLEWHKVHVEAGRWEHVISSEVEEKLVALLGDPATCPHGNPIPGHGRRRSDERSLSSVAVDEEVELLRITELVEHDDLALIEMDAAGFIPGHRGRVTARGEDGSVELLTAGGRLLLDPSTAANCFVSP
jgi:DtxR family Mn-dependent transcriptional regulator